MTKVTIAYLLKRAAFKFPDREAIISESGRWTFQQWEQNSNKRAHAFARHGIKKGDHVATLFLNGNEVLETFLALLKLGAIIVPLNARHSSKELRYVIDHSDASAIVFSHEFESIIGEIKGELPKITQYFFCGINGPDDMVEFGETYENESGDNFNTEIEERDIAFILYTAGTTGRPKGVLLSHSNWIWTATNAIFDADVQTGDRALLVFPLYHAAAIQILTVNLYMGCSNVTMKSFDPKRVMELIEKDQKATSHAITTDDWLHTGDCGRLDEDDFLYIVDRKKDMIITGGENVYPREIEEVLYRHPKILEAAVIGLPDPVWGEKIHAVVALKDGELLNEQEVINYTRENLSSFKKPKSIRFVDRLPRSSTGKVLKYVIREQEKDSS
ncbi:MAG: AMP-binding protein [Desulfobacterales bacterium]